jgi:hypothetical protein
MVFGHGWGGHHPHPETTRYLAMAKEQEMDRHRAQAERFSGERPRSGRGGSLLTAPWRMFRRVVGRVDSIGPIA